MRTAETIVVRYQGGNNFLVNGKAVQATTVNMMTGHDTLTEAEQTALTNWLNQNRFRRVRQSIYTL